MHRAHSQDSARLLSNSRNRLRSGTDAGLLLQHDHQPHLRCAAALRLSGAAGPVGSEHGSSAAGGLGRFSNLHGSPDAGHLLSGRRRVRRQAARADRRRLRVLDQARVRSALEKPGAVHSGAGENRRNRSIATARAEGQAAVRLRGSEIEGLRVLDRYTFQIRLEQPNPRFVYTLALANPLGAVAHEVVEAYGDQIMAHPVGTGPFRLAQWTRTSRIVLERNPTYREEIYDFAAPANSPHLARDVERLRGRRVPLVDRVEVTIIEEAQPRLAVVRARGARSSAGADRIRNAGRTERKAGAESCAARRAARCDADGRSCDELLQYGASTGRRLHAGEGRIATCDQPRLR